MPKARTVVPDAMIPSPPLITGDRLDAEEFLRRYNATDDGVKAELIEGVVFMASPVLSDHGGPHYTLAGWLWTYAAATPALKGFSDTTVEIDGRRVPQPDLSLTCLPPRPVQSRIGPRRMLVGCPDLVVEVANSSVRIDLGRKRRMYARAGVREYLVWRARRGVAVWYTRVGDALSLIAPDADGVLRSRAFPGLWLDAAAVAAENDEAVMACLRAGLATPDHAAFAAAGRG